MQWAQMPEVAVAEPPAAQMEFSGRAKGENRMWNKIRRILWSEYRYQRQGFFVGLPFFPWQ